MNTKKQKLIIAFTVLLDVIGVGIVIPILPSYVGQFSSSPVAVTWLFTVFSLCAFFSTPILGLLSDRIGRRPVLIVSLASTSLGWLVFAGAPSLFFLFLGRIIDGLAAGNFSTAQSYLVDISRDEKERTSNLGVIGSMFGLGFIIGPALGGVLSKISHSFPFWVVGVLALLNTILAYFYLPETNKNLNLSAKISFNPFVPILKAIKNKVLRATYTSWLMFGLAFAGFQAILALYLGKVFGIDAFWIGIIMMANGLITAINQGFVIRRFWLKRFKEPQLELWMSAVMMMGMMLMGIKYLSVYLVGFILMILSQPVLRTVIMSQAVGAAAPQQKGEVIGIMTSIMSLGMIVGPMIMGPVYLLKPSLPFFFSAFFMFISAVILYNNRRRLSRLKLEVQSNVTNIL